MNGYDIFTAATLITNGEFSNVDNFLNIFAPYFEDVAFDQKSVLSRINEIVNRISADPLFLQGKSKHLKHFIKKDLDRIAATLRSQDMHIDNPLEEIKKTQELLARLLAPYGLSFSRFDCFIVDEFPSPYETMSFSALNIDHADQVKYGIPRGIYFKKSKMIPYYSSSLLCHEVFHQLISEKNPNLIARGLEEGICDILGSLFFFSMISSVRIASQIMINKRYVYPIPQARGTYIDAFNQAAFVYREFGLDGIFFLVNKGREFIKEIEATLYNGRFEIIDIPRGNWDSNLDSLINIVQIFPQSIVLSPEAKFLYHNASIGEELSHLYKHCSISNGDTYLAELKNRVFLIITRDGVIRNIDHVAFNNTLAIKYEV